ncbi:MAG TPA: flagellin [Chloroflexota bacterium]|nr:flagellin [Chloroflexota bacterium]
MSMRINTNLDALNAQRNLATTGLAYSKSVAKLSSGMRINSAADDAAGLTISEKLRAQTAGLGQASRNAQDGISLIQTGEGALNETASILQRMRELTVQGGNDTLQASDRGAIKSEMDQLSSEISRISGTTQFNGITLLNGSLSAKGTVSAFNNVAATNLTGFVASSANVSAPVVAQAAVRTGSAAAAATVTTGGALVINGVSVTIGSGDTRAQVVTDINSTTGLGATGAVTASLDANNKLVLTSNAKGAAATVTVGSAASASSIMADLNITSGSTTGFDAPPASTAGSYQVTITQSATAGTVSGTVNSADLAGAGGAANDAGNLVINGVTIALAGTETIANIENLINKSGAGVTASGAAGAPMVLTNNDKGANAITVTTNGVAGTNHLLLDLGLGVAGANTTSTTTVVAGKNAAGTYASNGGTATAFTAANGSTLLGGGLQIDTALNTGGATTALNSFTFTDTNKAANLQIGANAGQTLGVGIEDMSATALGVANLDVSTSTAINAAGTGTLALIDTAIASVSAQRATLGAYQNRLEHTISNLGVSQSNLTASESRIRDVDMAAEMVNFTKTGILQQAGQAILAQANQSGSGVMSLLR